MPRKPASVFVTNILAYIIAYYMSVFMHEWGHGTIAWLYGLKSTPFDVTYGGWLLLNVDEHVNYPALLAQNQGVAAALIGIAGPTVSLIMSIICFILLRKVSIKRNSYLFSLVYWFLIISMIPILQYLMVSAFSTEGDTGRFIQSLQISPWLIFIPGTIYVILAIWRILSVEIIKAYIYLPIKSIWGQRTLLLVTLIIMFLQIYTGGFNPFTDPGVIMIDRYLAALSIIAVPILLFICDPSRLWVKAQTDKILN